MTSNADYGAWVDRPMPTFTCRRCGDELVGAIDLAAHDFCRNRMSPNDGPAAQ